MAKAKFRLKGQGKLKTVYLYLTLGRNNFFERSTGFKIDLDNWSKKSNEPKQTIAENKNLSTRLRKLKTFVYEKYNNTDDKDDVTGEWLKITIDEFFGRVKIENKELTYLIPFGEKYISELKYKTVRGKQGLGVKDATYKKYITILNKLKKFEKHRKKRIRIKDVNMDFRNELIEYFDENENLSDNTIGRYIKFVKTFILKAREKGFAIHKDIAQFYGWTVAKEALYLSFDELNKINNTEYQTKELNIAKDWLMIGCFTGQRQSDLFRMNKSFIQSNGGFEFIVLEQVKTEKLVQIPLRKEVKEVLDKRNGEFPPLLHPTSTDSNKNAFNLLVKEVCRIANIDELTKGSIRQSRQKGSEQGEFEKWRLISSHVCRRSFASNFYGKVKTPLLMNITAHSTEKAFLTYVGKKPIDQSLELAKEWSEAEAPKKRPTPTLTLERTRSDSAN